MKNSFLFVLLFTICVSQGIAQKKDSLSKKNNIEKPKFMGYDVAHKIPPDTISLKVKMESEKESVHDCNDKKTHAMTFKIVEFLGNGQGISHTFNKNQTATFIIPAYLKESIKKKKGCYFSIYIKKELCFEGQNELYSLMKIF